MSALRDRLASIKSDLAQVASDLGQMRKDLRGGGPEEGPPRRLLRLELVHSDVERRFLEQRLSEVEA
jgi:hypothetical protein